MINRASEASGGSPLGTSNTIRLPHTAVAVGVARRRIRTELLAAGVAPPLLDDVEVVVSELLGNAVRHAQPIGGGVLLAGWRLADGTVTVRVTDGGSMRRVEKVDGSATADTGRGLRIVDRLAADWGVTDHPAGMRTVWASFPIRATARGLRLVR